MTKERDLHQAARKIFDSALRSVDAREATRRALKLESLVMSAGQSEIEISGREIYVIAIGKAAMAMAKGAEEVLAGKITAGLIVGQPLPAIDSLDRFRWQIFHGGHPLPTQPSLDGARAAFDLLRRADKARALVVFLVSGGGSAMIEWPGDDRITLADLREANRQLVSCGASITEINVVRRAFSAVKGGRLGAMAPNADRITLIISDTNRGDEASVASGPTLSPPSKYPTAMDVVERYRPELSLPISVLKAIQEDRGVDERSDVVNNKHCVLLDNQDATEAAATEARQLGFAVEVAFDINEQPIEEGSALMIARLNALWKEPGRESKEVCLISGGEFSCPVAGGGIGGRNLETVLRCAVEFDKRQGSGNFAFRNVVALSAGTDGIDGNSLAAGALADEGTIAKALSRGLNPKNFLKNSDAFTFFNTLGDAIFTGPTGTNVRDLRILIASS